MTRAMGCHSAKTAQTAEAEGWQPGDVGNADGRRPHCPSEAHRSFIYSTLIISPGSGACPTSRPDKS